MPEPTATSKVATQSRPSPNHNSRGTKEIKCVVLHADASPNERGTLSWIQASESKVSYHTLIGRDGTIYRCVPYDRRAWHAGKASWQGEKDVNGISIGVAIASRHDGKEPMTDAQKASLHGVLTEIRAKYGPLPVTTHAAIAPGRKTDPEAIPNFTLADYA